MSGKEVSKRESINLGQIIEQALSKFDARLKGIENRLSQVETGQILMDEQHAPAEIGQLGGRTLSTSATGAVRRDVKVSFCDVCGKRIEEENLTLCYSCGRKLCDKCLIKLSADFLCVECLKDRLPLSKKEFKVLVAITNEIVRIGEIEKITKIVEDDVRSAVSNLLLLGLLRKKGISIASRLEVTHDGLEACGAYRAVYYTDEDVTRFYDEMASYLGEKVRR